MPKILNYLIVIKKANIKLENQYLIQSSIRGHKEIVELLIENGLDINQKDNLGRNALNLADEEGNKGYFSYNPFELSIELNENIIFFKLDETNIDDNTFNSINDLVNYIYN